MCLPVGFVKRSSYLATDSHDLFIHYFFFFFFCPTDQPTFTRERAMGNETFFGWPHLKLVGVDLAFI